MACFELILVFVLCLSLPLLDVLKHLLTPQKNSFLILQINLPFVVVLFQETIKFKRLIFLDQGFLILFFNDFTIRTIQMLQLFRQSFGLLEYEFVIDIVGGDLGCSSWDFRFDELAVGHVQHTTHHALIEILAPF